MSTKYFRPKRLRLPLIALFVLNIVVFTYYHVAKSIAQDEIELFNISLDSNDPLAEISTSNANYLEAVADLIAKIPSPKLTTKYKIPRTNTDPISQDPRLTFGLILNQINENSSISSIPFSWADWVDLSLLNHQLNKPVAERLKCKDLMSQVNLFSNEDKEKCEKDSRYFGCLATKDLTSEELQSYGVDSHEQLPGFIQFEHTVFPSNEYIRNIQAKTYVLTQMPLPYKVVFLNDQGSDIVLDVHKGNVKSLLDNYHKNTIDPLLEFEKLIPKGSNPYSPKPIVELEPSLFTYSRLAFIERAQEMRERTNLTREEKSYLYSMMASLSAQNPLDHEHPYFKEATLRLTPDNSDSGWHYDWRFFNGKLRDKARTGIILERLLRNWFKFTEKYGIISWIAHGPLLSWYWNGAVFPYDNDLDVQMPIQHLAKLGEFYNQTLVVEDLHEGMGKYLIEVGTFIHNRDISSNGNHIDARFIDVDTGVYIDITGLAIGHTNKVSRSHSRGNIHDRRKHFYNIDELAPLKLSMLNGVPCYVSNKLVYNLRKEYSSGIRRKSFNDYYFSGKLNIWIHILTLSKVFDANDFIQKNNGAVNKLRIRRLMEEMTDDQIFDMLSNDDELLLEYRLANNVREFHTEELRHLIRTIPKKTKVMDNLEITDEYIELLKKVRLHEPFRESLFEYERINGGLDEFYRKVFTELDSVPVAQ